MTTKSDLRRRIGEKKLRLQEVSSQWGPIILAIIGLLTLIIAIGFIIVVIAAIWSWLREKEAKRLVAEIALLESELEDLIEAEKKNV